MILNTSIANSKDLSVFNQVLNFLNTLGPW